MSFVTYIQNILYRFSTSRVPTYKPCCCKTKKNKGSAFYNRGNRKHRSRRRRNTNKKYSKRKY